MADGPGPVRKPGITTDSAPKRSTRGFGKVRHEGIVKRSKGKGRRS